MLKTIEWETAQIEDRSYNDAGLLTGVDRTYVDETRTYNAGSQLTQISSTNVGSQTYTYDLNGNVTSETLSGNMANYSFTTISGGNSGYDDEDRFMRFIRSGVSEDIQLTRSDIGNISNVNLNGGNTARGYNNIHGLTSVGAASQTYDTDGNTTTLHTAVTAAWDDAGRMKNTDVQFLNCIVRRSSVRKSGAMPSGQSTFIHEVVRFLEPSWVAQNLARKGTECGTEWD